MHLDETLLMTVDTWKEISQINDQSPHMRSIVAVCCEALGLEVSNYNVSGKKGPRAPPAQIKMKFPLQVIRIAKSKTLKILIVETSEKLQITILAFFRIKLCMDNKEFYSVHYSQTEFELLCPKSAKDYDTLTASTSGEQNKADSLGKLGTYINQTK